MPITEVLCAWSLHLQAHMDVLCCRMFGEILQRVHYMDFLTFLGFKQHHLTTSNQVDSVWRRIIKTSKLCSGRTCIVYVFPLFPTNPLFIHTLNVCSELGSLHTLLVFVQQNEFHILYEWLESGFCFTSRLIELA